MRTALRGNWQYNRFFFLTLVVTVAFASGFAAHAATTWTVSTTSDDSGTTVCDADVCHTLRDAIHGSSAGDTIELSGLKGTIALTSGQLAITHNLTIDGPGASYLAINGSQTSRIFDIGDATVALSGLTITNGQDSSGTGAGGGIYNAGDLTVADSTLSGNTASGNASGGAGGIFNSGTLTVTDSALSGNTASGNSAGGGGNGGGIFNSGTLTVTGSTFSGNTASGNATGGGGGIYNAGTLTVTNSTLSSNTGSGNAGGGGGGIFNGGSLAITNSTVISNTASGNFNTEGGGGIYNVDGTADLLNTLVIGNTAPNSDVSGSFDGSGTAGYNLIGSVGTATGFSAAKHDILGASASVVFGGSTLANNGGPTQTIALISGSPAIDAGSNAVLTAPYSLATDQRGTGFPREVGSAVDIGAYEFSVPKLTLTFSPTTVTAGAMVTATLTRTPDAGALTVKLAGNDTAHPVAPTSVALPVGTATVTFQIGVSNSPAVTAAFYDYITASATGLTSSTAVLRVNAAPTVAQKLTLTLSPTSVTAGATVTATLTRTATTGALTVKLAGNDTAHPVAPTSVTMPAGTATVTFQIGVSNNPAVTAAFYDYITASATGLTSSTAVLRVNAAPTVAQKLTLTFSPTSVTAGATVTATLTRTATTGALIVSLAGNDTAHPVAPTSVTMPAGTANITFQIGVSNSPAVTAAFYDYITASATGQTSSTAVLRVNAAAQSGGSSAQSAGLSTAGAFSSANSVRLSFITLLDASAANDTSLYSVTINGIATTVQSAGYARGVVTLSLPNGALHSGDTVVVRWSGLPDACGHALNGGSGSITAR